MEGKRETKDYFYLISRKLLVLQKYEGFLAFLIYSFYKCALNIDQWSIIYYGKKIQAKVKEEDEEVKIGGTFISIY